MSWDLFHRQSEQLAVQAEQAARANDKGLARHLYQQAAEAETNALQQLSSGKPRTLGITSVSAVALWYKANAFERAEQLAHVSLGSLALPDFARSQIRELLTLIWTTRSAEAAGVLFLPGDVLVSVKGGDVVYGGAPLDLIVQKVEGVQALLLRTVEMLLGRQFRRRGAPTPDVQSMFRPWLFQAPAGSYQFAVRVQEPAQLELWQVERPRLEQITGKFFEVLQAATVDPAGQLAAAVPDKQYREAFLSLARNLAPTGKRFERLEVRDAGSPTTVVASFEPVTRQELNAALRRSKPEIASVAREPGIIRGTLRALHLDQDWLELTTQEDPARHLRIENAGDALDDVVGPMVNRLVKVSVLRTANRLTYQDIELDD